MLEAIPLRTQTSILLWIHAYIALNLTMATFANSPHNAMQMAPSTFVRLYCQLLYKINRKAVTKDNQRIVTRVATHSIDPQLDGICAFSGKI